MASVNYVLLEKITVGAAGASSVTFSGIPQTGYTDLVVKISSRSTSNGGYTYVSFNGSTTSYSTKDIVNSNGTVSSSGYTLPGGVSWMVQSSYTASTFTNSEVYIPNYTSANYKSFSLDSTAENNSTNYTSGLEAALWSNTAAITSITCTPNTANYAEFSTFYLYGVAKLGTTPAIVPYATGGDIIETDGTYWYHAFLSSGTFTPAKGLSCDVLVVAGGGGTGTDFTSGAGAGGYRSATAQTAIANTGVTVTVGAGGTGGSAGGGGTSGSNSSYASFSATGGARSGTTGAAGVSGGSGSGAPIGSNAGTGGAGNAGGYSPVEGYKGGDSVNTGVPRATGGGGGAGAAGGNGNTSGNGGAGGAGSNAHSSWLSVLGLGVSGYLAGGGGGTGESAGTAGGAGGGGTGGNQGNGAAGKGTNGTANTGSGGGGGGNGGGNGSAGGSGLVIVRYAV